MITSAEVHDSKGFEGLIKDEGKDLYLSYVGFDKMNRI